MDSLDNMTTSPYIQTLYSENMTHDNIDPLNVTSEPVSQEFYEIMFVHFQMMIEGICIPVLTCLGLLGNIASIIVLRSPGLDMKITFRQILMMLAMFDSMFIICMTVSFSLPKLIPAYSTSIHPWVAPWASPVIQISLCGSTFSTVAVAVERFASVVYAHNTGRYLRHFSYIFVLPVIIFSFVFNVSRFFELRTCYMLYEDHNETPMEVPMSNVSELCFSQEQNVTFSHCLLTLCQTDLRLNSSYQKNYILLTNSVMMVLGPFLAICTLNRKLYLFIRENSTAAVSTMRQKREKRIAAILVVIVVVFITCNLPRVIINLYEVMEYQIYGDKSWPIWCDILSTISNFLLVVNSSSNLLIYCAKDQKFRRVLMFKLGVPNSELNEVNWELMSRDRRPDRERSGGFHFGFQMSIRTHRPTSSGH